MTGETWGKHRKKIPEPAHKKTSENSLIWAVYVESHNKDNVDKIADDLDLINLGQVGELHNHYLFAHKLHSNFSGTKTVSTVHKHHSRIHSKQKIAKKVTETEEHLERHPDINWFSHQKVLSRGKRFLTKEVSYMDFEDPYYRSQWHLVSLNESLLHIICLFV